ncbi:hypothetical protein Y032_0012g1671 [Ancylostoma ceylanicum]|uniref:Uncharacterized protein n=1 Tax=Ancylostoma ceylanicum TaxID=53326 RepID=A0A016VCU6_9BILA|nr:hypothetical protein Y032_0012g1671 [Ancylostoma ceylanicum]
MSLPSPKTPKFVKISNARISAGAAFKVYLTPHLNLIFLGEVAQVLVSKMDIKLSPCLQICLRSCQGNIFPCWTQFLSQDESICTLAGLGSCARDESDAGLVSKIHEGI